MSTIKELLDQIIEDGIMTQEEHDTFITQISADGKIDADESAQISRLFRLIQEGKVRVVDVDRERAMADRQADLEEKLKGLDNAASPSPKVKKDEI